jgi:hypothetical protein
MIYSKKLQLPRTPDAAVKIAGNVTPDNKNIIDPAMFNQS